MSYGKVGVIFLLYMIIRVCDNTLSWRDFRDEKTALKKAELMWNAFSNEEREKYSWFQVSRSDFPDESGEKHLYGTVLKVYK